MAGVSNHRRLLQFNLKTLIGIVVLFAVAFSTRMWPALTPCLICGLIGAQLSKARGQQYAIPYTLAGSAIGGILFVFGLQAYSGLGELSPVSGDIIGWMLILAIASIVGTAVGFFTWIVLEFCGHFDGSNE